MEFSKKDLGIVFELNSNSRSSLNKIAKRLKMSQQGLSYKIEKLKERGIISSYHTIFDYSCFGYTSFRVFFNLNATKTEQLQALLHYLGNHKAVLSIIECGGKWDLIVIFATKNASKFNKELHALMNRFPKVIRNYTILTTVVSHNMGRSYLIENATHTGSTVVGGDREEVKIDLVETKLMKELLENPRVSTVHIAAKYKLNPKTILAKIKSLETKGIIKGYSTLLDCYKYNFISYKIFLRYHNLSFDREEELLKFCRQQKSIVRISKTFGEWDLEIDVELPDTLEFRKLCLLMKTHFGDIMKDFEIAQVFKIHKVSYLPQNFFSE